MSIDASPKALSTPLAADKSKPAEARGGDADEQSRPVRSTRKSQSSAKKAASTTLSTPTREASTAAAASSSKKGIYMYICIHTHTYICIYM
jgi:outer membrane biosynthesis protein TonB